VTTKSHLLTLLSLLMTFVAACGPFLSNASSEPCDYGNWAPRCTDGVVRKCEPADDCRSKSCSIPGACEPCHDYPHVVETRCADTNEQCVILGHDALCQ
jgi:hypothetical protein